MISVTIETFPHWSITLCAYSILLIVQPFEVVLAPLDIKSPILGAGLFNGPMIGSLTKREPHWLYGFRPMGIPLAIQTYN